MGMDGGYTLWDIAKLENVWHNEKIRKDLLTEYDPSNQYLDSWELESAIKAREAKTAQEFFTSFGRLACKYHGKLPWLQKDIVLIRVSYGDNCGNYQEPINNLLSYAQSKGYCKQLISEETWT